MVSFMSKDIVLFSPSLIVIIIVFYRKKMENSRQKVNPKLTEVNEAGPLPPPMH